MIYQRAPLATCKAYGILLLTVLSLFILCILFILIYPIMYYLYVIYYLYYYLLPIKFCALTRLVFFPLKPAEHLHIFRDLYLFKNVFFFLQIEHIKLFLWLYDSSSSQKVFLKTLYNNPHSFIRFLK